MQAFRYGSLLAGTLRNDGDWHGPVQSAQRGTQAWSRRYAASRRQGKQCRRITLTSRSTFTLDPLIYQKSDYTLSIDAIPSGRKRH